jgi:hypothetical protein
MKRNVFVFIAVLGRDESHQRPRSVVLHDKHFYALMHNMEWRHMALHDV